MIDVTKLRIIQGTEDDYLRTIRADCSDTMGTYLVTATKFMDSALVSCVIPYRTSNEMGWGYGVLHRNYVLEKLVQPVRTAYNDDDLDVVTFLVAWATKHKIAVLQGQEVLADISICGKYAS